MSTPFVIRRPIAITGVNAYYEIKKEGNNEENEGQFKINFIKFIVPYMNNAYFTEEIAGRLFIAINTLEYFIEEIAECLFVSISELENKKENYCTDTPWKCKKYYNCPPSEVAQLFLSIINYHLLTGIKSSLFEPTKEMLDIMTVNDWVIEENDCYICKWHGYDIDWPIKEERGKFYYSIAGNINHPVCESCVKTNCLDIKQPNDVDSVEDESEIYGTVAYLRKNELVKCGNCGNIWDGCAQCNCWQWPEYKNENENENEDNSDEPIHKNVTIRCPRPTRQLPLPPSLLADKKDKKIIELEEQNKILSEQLSILKQKIEELFNLTKK